MRSIQRVLIVHPYGIGDLLFLTPVLRALRLIPTVEKVDLVVGSRTEAMIRPNPHVDNIITVDRDYMRSLSLVENLKAILKIGKQIKTGNYDLLIDYSSRGEYAAASKFLFRIPRRVGFDYKNRGRFLTHKLPIPEGFDDCHAVHYFADCAELAGVAVDHRVMEFYLSAEAVKACNEKLKALGIRAEDDFVIVSPGGGESWGKDAKLKRWPLDYFQVTLQRMRKECGVQHFLVVGSPQEKFLTEELSNAVEGAVSLAGETELMTVAALIQRAKFFIGNDGGLVHIAHALRKPLVAIYGPVDPKVYGPFPPSEQAVAVFKGPADYKRFRYNPNGTHIKEITPQMVWDAICNPRVLKTAVTP